MNIVALTDIHGSYKRAKEILKSAQPFDAIVIGGDLTTAGTALEAEEAIRSFQELGKPVFAVSGNMDSPEIDAAFDRLGILISGRGRILQDVGFFGVSGSPFTPMNTPYEISEDEIKKRAEVGWKDVENVRVKIFVPHAPPHGTKVDKIVLGKHVGSIGVKEFIAEHQPDVVVCGHIHEARGTDTIGKTHIINCGPAGRGYYGVIKISKTISVELKV